MEGKGWVDAGELKPGDRLVMYSGEVFKVKEIYAEFLVRPLKVYNFEVEDWHTYFVSEYNVFVHNTVCGDSGVGNKGTSSTRPYTKSSLKMGQEMHKAYKADVVDNITKFKEFRLPSGKRIDFIDFETKTIYELKPYNPNGIKTGLKQLEVYLKEVESIYGGGWKTILDTY